MEQNSGLKLFISYSHKDNGEKDPYIEEFIGHIAPLKAKGLIEEWYDRETLAGKDYQKEIDNNLNDPDIVCLFISANFLSSSSCKREKKEALELRKKKRIAVIPIILSYCGWQDDEDISNLHLLAVPTDGKPVTSFQNRDKAWHNVYTELKKVIEEEIKIRQLKIKKEFEIFLQDTEILEKAHSQKERVFLDDIFVYPELDKYDDLMEYEERISSEKLLVGLVDYPRILLAGEDRSGKTTLCKMMFRELRKRNFIPVYVSDRKTLFAGRIQNRISRSFDMQYEGVQIDKINKERIVPIIDDFHFAKNKEKHMRDLSGYPYCIAVVDDIFSLNIRDEKLIRSFVHFRIRELKPSLRDELIRKWVSLTDKQSGGISTENNFYQDIDRNTELIDSTLGRIFGSGIMPAYPFFILSIIFTYETFGEKSGREVTSQGHCYQAFIYFYLGKQGARFDEIDTYMNFLAEMAFCFYRKRKHELSLDDFTLFIRCYVKKYNLPMEQKTLLRNIRQIVLEDSLNNYSFRYPCFYYFFVAKYLAEHIEDSGIEKEIEKIMNNLHVNENAYITIFMPHHSRNPIILEKLRAIALCFFNKYRPGTLAKDEVAFFDKQSDIIAKAVLPPANRTPEGERANRLKKQDKLERYQKDVEQQEDTNKQDSFEKELRRAIKTVEVMGRIIKNRAGSLEIAKLKEVFEEAMCVHLRILSFFFELIRSEGEQKAIIDFISKRLRRIIEEKKKGPSEDKLRKISKNIFWNLNFRFVSLVIYKIVHSLGSYKLTNIMETVCDKVDTPASFLVKHGILMWCEKNLRVDELAKGFNKEEFSEIARRATRVMVADYCSLHAISRKDRPKIERELQIPAKQTLRKKL